MSSEPKRRLFFALWPDEALRASLADAVHDAVRACRGRPVPAANFHVTLAFLGRVPERRIPELAAIARAVAREFDPSRGIPQLTFDRIEYWHKPKVICAVGNGQPGTATTPTVTTTTATTPTVTTPTVTTTTAASALAELLRTRVSAAGFSPDLKPFRPHVTLARKVPRGSRALDMHSVLWSFAGFALIDSRTEPDGPIYSVVESWSLVTPSVPAP